MLSRTVLLGRDLPLRLVRHRMDTMTPSLPRLAHGRVTAGLHQGPHPPAVQAGQSFLGIVQGDEMLLTAPTDVLCISCRRRPRLVGELTCYPCRADQRDRFSDEGRWLYDNEDREAQR